MASESQLSQLVQACTGINSSNKNYAQLLEKVRIIVKRSRISRIDTAAITERLSGLEERYRISFEDEIADALGQRVRQLNRLGKDSHYIPECLQLILSLSTGRPIPNFEERVALARQLPERPSEPRLEDVVGDVMLWQNIDYTEGDSDDGVGIEPLEAIQVADNPKPVPIQGSTEAQTTRISDRSFATASALALEPVRQTIGRLERICDGSPEHITEALLLRECVFMLGGRPCHIFEMDSTNKIRPRRDVRLTDISDRALNDVLSKMALIGNSLLEARDWVLRTEDSPTLRRFQSVVDTHFSTFAKTLQTIEQMILKPDRIPVTMLSITHLAYESTRSLRWFSSILSSVKHATDRQDAKLMEILVDGVLENDIIHDVVLSQEITAAFQVCFAVYWRPIDIWLQGFDDPHQMLPFIHKATEEQIAPEHNWEKLFTENRAAAPAFLQPFVRQILIAGKTRYMLTKLQQEDPDNEANMQMNKINLAFTSIQQHCFETFDLYLHRVVQGRLRMNEGVNSRVLTLLSSKWRLSETLTALEMVFLAKAGSISDKAHTALFRLLDTSKSKEWKDRFVLTNIFQEAFRKAHDIDVSRLTVSTVDDARANNSRTLSLVQLEAIRINYAFAWPLSNIVDTDSVARLQKVAILLMQIARAKDVLDQHYGLIKSSNVIQYKAGRRLARLQQRMRWFVNTLHSYMALDILSKASSTLWDHIEAAADLDGLIQAFRHAIASLEYGCLLSRELESTHRAIVSLLDLPVVLSDVCMYERIKPRSSSGTVSREDVSEDEDENPITLQQRFRSSAIENADLIKLKELASTFHQLLTFVQAGVRDASRSASDHRLEMFANDILAELTSMRS